MDVRRRTLLVLTLVAALLAGTVLSAEPRTAGADAPSAPTSDFEAVDAERILDTSTGLGLTGPLAGGTTYTLDVAGVGSVPQSGVSAVALNLTASGATANTYVLAWDEGRRPTASSLNVDRGETVSNMVIVPLAEDGSISLYHHAGRLQLSADVVGFFAESSDLHPLTPARILDTRINYGARGALGENKTIDVDVLGEGGVPRRGVSAVVVNLTATRATQATWLTVWPSGQPRPNASNLNVSPGEARPNLVVVPVGSDGEISIFNRKGSVHVIVDVLGWLPTESPFHVQRPQRILDTRVGLGIPNALGQGATAKLQIAGRGGVPTSGAQIVILNLTGTAATKETIVRAWSGAGTPRGWNLSLRPGQTRANIVFVRIAADGTISLYNHRGSVHLIADVLGWIGRDTSGGGGGGGTTTTTVPPTTSTSTTTSTTTTTIPPTTTSTTTTTTTSTTTTTTTIPPTTTSTTTTTTIPPTTSTSTTTTTIPPTTSTSTTTTTIPPTTTSTTTTTIPPTTTSTTTTTTIPPTTSTTEPPNTSTTTTEPGTTTTTTEPVDPPAGSTWQFDQESVSFTGPGQSKVVCLQLTAPDGSDTGTPPPVNPAVEVIGDTGAVTVEDLGDGSWRLTSTDQIGSIVMAVDVPGSDLDIPVVAMNVRLQPGVQTIDDGDILFPPPGVPEDADLATAGVPGIDGTHVGPFTWQELQDRALVGDAAAPAAGARIPVVLKGSAPAVGTRLYGVGSQHLAGTVVEPAGLPSLERSGHSLISLRLDGLQDIYSAINWDFTYDDLANAALVPLEYRLSHPCPADVPAADCPEPSVVTVIAGVNDQPGGGRATHSVTPQAPRPEGWIEEHCDAATGSATLADIKFVGAEALKPKGQWLATDGTGGVGRAFQVEFGFDLTIGYGVSVRLQVNGAYGIPKCLIKKLASLAVPSGLMGPWAELATPYLDADVVANAQAQFSGGPRIDLSKTCSVTYEVRAGFRWIEGGEFQNRTRFTKVDNPDPCPASGENAGVDVGTLTSQPITIDLTLFGGLAITTGVHFGGITTHWLGTIFGDSEFGDFPLVGGKAGIQLHVTWENSQSALAAKSASSTVALELAGDLGLEGDFLEWVLGKVGYSNGPGMSVQFISATMTLATLYRPLSSSALTVRVQGEERPSGAGDTVEVRPGDTLRVESTLQYKASLLPLVDAVLTSGSDWEKPGGIAFVESDLFTTITALPRAAGQDQQMVYETTITPAMCEHLGNDSQTISLLADAKMFNLISTPAYAGNFNIKCLDTAWEFREGDEIRIERDQVGTTHFAHIKHAGYTGYEWTLARTDGGQMPAWLTMPEDGTVPFGSADIDLPIDIDCSAMDPQEQRSVEFKAAVTDPPSQDNPHEDTITITVDCRPPFIEVLPVAISGSGNVTLKTWGVSVGVWKVDPASIAGAPDWLKVGGDIAITPKDGVYGNGMHTEQLAVTVAPWPDDCLAHNARSYTVRFITEHRSGPQEDRKTASLVVVQPGRTVPGGCRNGTAGEHGDPHMYTFDGNYFDAQVLGEYIYVRPTAGSAAMTVQVRHEATRPGSVALAQPTSATAVVVKEGNRRIEVYGRSTLELVVDGVTTTLADTQSLTVGSMTVARSGRYYTIDTSTGSVAVSAWGAGMDVRINVPAGTPIEGLLGSPDGNAANDLSTAGGTQLPVADVREHGPALYEFTDSWRLTSTSQSLFTRTYSGFADNNPPYNSAALEPYRQQIRDLLDAAGNVCATSGSTATYLVDALAFELAIGRDIGELGQYTCRYEVSGYASSGPRSLPIDGLTVHIDGVGVESCTTVTNSSGYYSCAMGVSVAELAGGQPGAPTVQITTEFPEQPGDTITSQQVIFPGLAPLGGVGSIQYPIDVPIEALPSLNVTGHVTGAGGAPLTGTYNMFVFAYNENNQFVGQWYSPLVGSPYDGSYSVLFPMPRAVKKATVAIQQVGTGSWDWRQINVDNIQRERRVVPFDIDYRPPTLQLSGTLLRNGAPDGPSNGVLVDSYRADGSKIARQSVSTPPNMTTGAYYATLVLPDDTVRAVIVDQRYYDTAFDEYTQEVTGLVPDEVRPVTHDLNYLAKTVTVSGHVTKDGVTATGYVAVSVKGENPPPYGGYPFNPYPNQFALTNGNYSVTFGVSANAPTAEIIVSVPGGTPYGVVQRVPVVAGNNPVTLDIDDVATNLVVSGDLVCNGVPITAQVSLPVAAKAMRFGSEVTYMLYPNVTPDSNGHYSTTVRLPFGTTHADVSVSACSIGAGTGIDIVPFTDNPVTLDIRTYELRVAGRIIGPPERLQQLLDNGISADVTQFSAGNSVGIWENRQLSWNEVYDDNDQLVGIDYWFGPFGLQQGVDEVEFAVREAWPSEVVLATQRFTGISSIGNDRQFDVDLFPPPPPPTTTPFDIDIVLSENAIALQGDDVEVEVHTYLYTNWDTPHVELEHFTVPLTTDFSGHAATTVQISNQATLVRITLRRASESEQEWTYTRFVTAGERAGFTRQIELEPSRLTYRGNVILEGCTSPLLFYRQVWVASEELTTQYDWNTGNWPGATLMWADYVVPDSVPDADGNYRHSMALHLPADTVWIGTVYMDHHSSGTGGGPIVASSGIGVEADEYASC